MKNNAWRQLALAIALACSIPGGTASAEDQTAATSAPLPTPAQYAQAVLKKSADRLSGANNFTVKIVSSAESLSPGGPMILYFSTAEVAVQRPNKMSVKRSGDGASFDLYYDGKTFSGVDAKLGLYATMNAPPTLDVLIPAVAETIGIPLPYADFLMSDVFAALMNGITYADAVGKVDVDGVPCEHLVFAGPGIEWQIWLGPEDNPLPRRLAVTYVYDAHRPHFVLNLSDWNLNAELPPGTFDVKLPSGAVPIEFHAHSANATN